MEDFQLTHFALLDLEYFFLEDGFLIIATTDVPCHLYCRMTKTPPLKHSLPSMRRGLRLTGDIRFCFVVYEDNEQVEDGDTILHTWYKRNWPVCETRWFYFIGSINGATVVSETAIFHLHFKREPYPMPNLLQTESWSIDDSPFGPVSLYQYEFWFKIDDPFGPPERYVWEHWHD